MIRRDFLYGLGASIGSIAFSEISRGDDKPNVVNNADQQAHFPKAKAKHCIFLYMEGGPSHIDTFDPKPKLKELHLKEFTRQGKEQSAMSSGKRYYVQSPFQFAKHGESGADMCDRWENLSGVADELCFYRGCTVESVNHPTANYHVNTGNRFGGDPRLAHGSAMAWVPKMKTFPGLSYFPNFHFRKAVLPTGRTDFFRLRSRERH